MGRSEVLSSRRVHRALARLAPLLEPDEEADENDHEYDDDRVAGDGEVAEGEVETEGAVDEAECDHGRTEVAVDLAEGRGRLATLVDLVVNHAHDPLRKDAEGYDEADALVRGVEMWVLGHEVSCSSYKYVCSRAL